MKTDADICPNPTEHEPQCYDTRYDDRGDCDGGISQYVATNYVLGAQPGGSLLLCSSHGRQASRKQEARRI